jgi:hypothetical protein
MVSGWVTIHQQGSKYNHNSNRFNNSVMQKFVQYLKQPRQLVQLSVLLITIGVGIQFYLYVQQAMGQGPFTIQRPAGVEGFLPIGAFMGWNFFSTRVSGIGSIRLPWLFSDGRFWFPFFLERVFVDGFVP